MVIMGWFNIYAAVFNEERSGLFDITQLYGKQFLWIIAALVLAVFVVIIDSRFYLFFSWFIYGTTLFLLVLVLIFGKEINGARSWFEFSGVNLQPSEFAKIGTSLAVASYLNSKRHNLTKLDIVPAVLLILFPIILITFQPDWGSALIYFSFFLVFFREGLSPYIFISGLLMILLFFLSLLVNTIYLTAGLIVLAFFLAWFLTQKRKMVLIGAGIFIAIAGMVYMLDYYLFKSLGAVMFVFISLLLTGAALSYYVYIRKAYTIIIIYLFLVGSILFINSVDYTYNNVLKPHQKDRVSLVLGFKTDVRGTGYNVNQSIISIGSGGFSGKGFLKGTQTKYKYVPSQSTDFIFCTVGEEWGFLGSFVVIGIYLFFLLRLVFLAERQRSAFSRIYGYCVVSILFIHFFINIGMATGILPVIGIPLPFFSYGGSALWAFTILLFIFLRLDASRTEYLV
jgi:rod shape determining protein RodA